MAVSPYVGGRIRAVGAPVPKATLGVHSGTVPRTGVSSSRPWGAAPSRSLGEEDVGLAEDRSDLRSEQLDR